MKQASKRSQLHQPAPSLLFLHQVTSHPSHPLILLPREKFPHPLCCGQRSSTSRLRRKIHRDILHLLDKWSRGMDSLRNIEVKTNNLASSQSLFSQGRMWHTSVQINEKIILIGGDQSETGEIVKEGNWENNINIACYDSSNQL